MTNPSLDAYQQVFGMAGLANRAGGASQQFWYPTAATASSMIYPIILTMFLRLK